MTERETPLDKSAWGAGPWQDEPDRVEWSHVGLPCLAQRNKFGSWCGYVAVPPGHPLHGRPYGEPDVDVHGGLTYASLCHGAICHAPQPGEPDDVWWFGFDCGHGWDIQPEMEATLRARGLEFPDPTWGGDREYRTLAYVTAETNQLAEQLRERGR